MPNSSSNSSFALVLAAGRSTRMGRCKASLPWLNHHTLLTYQVEQWLLAKVYPIVVLGPHNAMLQKQLPDPCHAVINQNPDLGKASSILRGLEALPAEWRVLAIAAVDQPRPTQIYQFLLQQHFAQSIAPKGITAPIYQGRMGHPLLFGNKLLPRLQAIQEEQLGLRQVIQECDSDIHRVEVNDPIVLADLNTPEIYQTWFQQ